MNSPEAPPSTPPAKGSRPAPADSGRLFNRDYLLQFIGQSISRVGSRLYLIALLLLIKRETGSASVVGLLQVIAMLPAILLSPVAGTLADRVSRKKILIYSDLIRGIAVAILAGWLYFNPQQFSVTLVLVVLTAVITSTVNAFFSPAIQSTIPDLVPADKVVAANSIGQLSIQMAIFIGQGLGGVLFRVVGAATVFAINALSFFISSFMELFVNIPQALPRRRRRAESAAGAGPQTGDAQKSADPAEGDGSFTADLRAGLDYVLQRKGLRNLIFTSALLNFFSSPVLVLLPFFFEDVLKVRTDWYGYMLAMSGVGSMVGFALANGLRLPPLRRAWMMQGMIVGTAVGYGVLGMVGHPAAAVLLGFLGGLANGYVTVNFTTIVQLTAPGEMRGRVMGVLMMIGASLTPFAVVLSGVVADLIGQNIRLIYITSGIINTLLNLVLFTNRDYRELLQTDVRQAGPRQAAPGTPGLPGTPGY